MDRDEQLTWVSQYNLLPEVLGENHFPKKLKIYDTTLRDGEQTAGLCFDKHEKLAIAKALDEAGVDRIEAGMPVVSLEDRKAVELIVKADLKAEVWGFCRCVKADIDACAEAGVKFTICEIATSQPKLRAYGWTQEKVLNSLVEHLLYAKGKGLYTAFFSVDCSRTDLDFLHQVYIRAVNEGKADEVVVVDTLGIATPETMYFLTKRVREWVKVPIMTHCHNDFGLANACTMASIKAGAECAHVTVNGLGEKTGNVDIAEVALAAKVLYGMETNIKLDKLYDLAQKVAKISRIGLSPLKPVVGANVFKRESGVVIAQLIKYPPSVEGYAPELVGREREIVLGKKSGKNSIEFMLEKIGVKASLEQVEVILGKVKDLGLQKKGLVEPGEFEKIVREVM